MTYFCQKIQDYFLDLKKSNIISNNLPPLLIKKINPAKMCTNLNEGV